MRWRLGVVCVVLCCPSASWAQGPLCHPTLAPRAAPPQIADTDFNPPLPAPAFAAGQGPSVNLRAPVVINPARMVGCQVMPHDSLYPLRHPLAAE